MSKDCGKGWYVFGHNCVGADHTPSANGYRTQNFRAGGNIDTLFQRGVNILQRGSLIPRVLWAQQGELHKSDVFADFGSGCRKDSEWMRDVEQFRNWAVYFHAQNVLKNSAKPVIFPLSQKIQIEIANESVSYVRIYWVGWGSFHKRNRKRSMLCLAFRKHRRRLIASWLRLFLSIWSNPAGPRQQCQP